MPLEVGPDGPALVEDIVPPTGGRIRESLRDQMHEWWRRNTYPYALGAGRESWRTRVSRPRCRKRWSGR